MPELPEIELYLHALRSRVLGERLEGVRVASPSLLKTFDPPVSAAAGRVVSGLRRVGKRVVLELAPAGDVGAEGTGDDAGDVARQPLFLVIHLMITGRFRWLERGAPIPRKVGHAALDFASGTLLLTEQGPKKRASLHVVAGEARLAALDPGGLEVLEADLAAFRERLLRENRTLKRALTDPRILSGIGNAHSDEILLRARLAPTQRTGNLTDEEVARLYGVIRQELPEWIERLREEAGETFPTKVTAFHPAMAAHGKYREPCPACGTPIQRITYAANETNYCPTCQTGGKLLADRALSRLLGEDWPKTLEELEELKRR